MTMSLQSSTLAAVFLKTDLDKTSDDEAKKNIILEIKSNVLGKDGEKTIDLGLLASITWPSGIAACTVEYRGIFLLDVPLPNDFKNDKELLKTLSAEGTRQLYPQAKDLILSLLQKIPMLPPIKFPEI